MANRGRPTSYKAEYVKQGYDLALLGATDEDLARAFGVDSNTIGRWKTAHADFCGALKAGKEQADATVAKSLYRRATGYSHDAVKIFCHEGTPVEAPYVEHYPPDTTACIFWLKNRRPDLWRDKVVQEQTGESAVRLIVESGVPDGQD